MESIIWLQASRNLTTSIISFEVLFNGEDRRLIYSNHRSHSPHSFLIRVYEKYYLEILKKFKDHPEYQTSDSIWKKLKDWAHTDRMYHCVVISCSL